MALCDSRGRKEGDLFRVVVSKITVGPTGNAFVPESCNKVLPVEKRVSLSCPSLHSISKSPPGPTKFKLSQGQRFIFELPKSTMTR